MSLPYFSLNLDQVRDSGLLSPERMAAVEAEIERRFSIPLTPDGRQITSARLIDCGEHGLHLYPVMTHELNWEYARRTLLGCVLTEEERGFLDQDALSAASSRRDEERFAKATKIPAAEWGGWVTDGDRYWDSVDSYLDETDPRETAEYLWVAMPQQVIPDLSADDITEHWISDRGWEECSLADFSGETELQAALDAFVKANESVVSYRQDYTRAVVL